MTTKRITIELTEEPKGSQSLTIKSENISAFESIGVLTHYIDQLTYQLRQVGQSLNLEKEMD